MILGFICILFFSTNVFAELSTTVKEDNSGLHLGRFYLSPSLRLSAGVNSNPLFSNVAAETDEVFYINPGINLTANRQHLFFQTGYNFNHIQFLENDIQNSDNHHANIDILYRSNRWNFEVRDQYSLTSDPADDEILERLDRIDNEASGIVNYMSPSKDLETQLKYTNRLLEFDGALQSLNNFQNLVMLQSIINISSFFHFLPKTTFNTSAEYAFIDFPNSLVGERSEGTSLRLNVGLNGRVTSKFSTLLEAGYSHFDFDVGPGNDGFTGRVELNYNWRRLNLLLGYSRGAEKSYFTNFYDINSFNIQASWRSPTQRWEVSEKVSLDYLDYSGPSIVAVNTTRNDQIVRNAFKLVYKLRPKLHLFGEYNFSQRSSNAFNSLTNSSTADFEQHIGIVGIFVYY